MKKIFTVLFILGLLVAPPAFAQMGMMGSAEQKGADFSQSDNDINIGAALQEIYKSQNITARKQVDCSKVTVSQLIKLGDMVMGYGITEAEHTAVENRMGGEESAMSNQAHENIGRSYLGCWANYQSGPMGMMMGSSSDRLAEPVGGFQGMMGQGFGLNMMGGYYGFGGLTTFFILALLLVGIVALTRREKKD